MTLLLAPGSLIQSNFITNGVPNFEAVLYWPNDGKIQHYFRENDFPDKIWKKAQVVNKPDCPVTGPAALCQSNIGKEGNFELVVPEPEGLAHYWHNNDNIASSWVRTGTIAPGSTDAGAILQNRRNNDLEVVVPHGRNLIHYWRNADGWHKTDQPISDNVNGPAALIQSSYADNLELVVLEGLRIVLYFRAWDAAGQPWHFGGVVTDLATGAPGFIQGQFGDDPDHNFEVVYPLNDRLMLSWRDNTPAGGKQWKPGGIVTWRAGNVDAVAMTRGSKWDQIDIISQECEETVYQYYRYQENNGERVYMRNGCLRIHEGTPGQSYPTAHLIPPRSFKVNQLTGSWDAQWRRPTQSTNPDTGIRGTDLGASFEHSGYLYFLFGDTHWRDGFPFGTADSIAYTADTNPWNGVSLYFHRSYMCYHFPGQDPSYNDALHGIYDVPQDGFSFRDRMFVFFSTNHFENGKVMGKSILTRCDDVVPDIGGSNAGRPLGFQFLTEFSRYRFTNVSVQYADAAKSRLWGLPYQGEGLLIWGTGAYRMDNIYLAFMPLGLSGVENALRSEVEIGRNSLELLYFCGLENGRPQWCGREEDAVPLFYPTAVGELSVRWDDTLKAFVMMYMSGPDDPIGPSVQLRLSLKPWGPWSKRRMAFNWILDGLGYRNHNDPCSWFIHVDSRELGYDDGLGDDIIGNRGPEQGGAAYAPYQIPKYTRHDNSGYHLFYTLSTWNPYQAVLMRHDLSNWDRLVLIGGLDKIKVVSAVMEWFRSFVLDSLRSVAGLFRKRVG